MFCEDVRQELRHPALNRVRVALDERADTQDGGMQLANGGIILRRLSIFRKLTVPNETDEAILNNL